MAEVKNIKLIDMDYIIKYCKENKEVKWLKEISKKEVSYTRYPKVKDAEGKLHVDKTQPPKTTTGRISFLQIRLAFCEKFMPELLPPKVEKKPSMYDIIDALEDDE